MGFHTTISEIRRYAHYLGNCARSLWGGPEYSAAKRQWLKAVDDLREAERQQAQRLDREREELEREGWRGTKK